MGTRILTNGGHVSTFIKTLGADLSAVCFFSLWIPSFFFFNDDSSIYGSISHFGDFSNGVLIGAIVGGLIMVLLGILLRNSNRLGLSFFVTALVFYYVGFSGVVLSLLIDTFSFIMNVLGFCLVLACVGFA